MRTQYNMHEAKTHLSKIIAAVEAGEEITICKNGTPVATIVPSAASTVGSRLWGAWRHMADGEIGPVPETTEDELRDWGAV